MTRYEIYKDCDNCNESYGPDQRAHESYLKDICIVHKTGEYAGQDEWVTLCKGSGPKGCEAKYAAEHKLQPAELGSQEQRDGAHYTR
tara:strand:- start:319 stop:579 length:261 start_codon:yes stop_codon:yes gene_type:complete